MVEQMERGITLALAILVAIGIWMGGYWMGEQLPSVKSNFTMKRRQNLVPIFFFSRKIISVILPAVFMEGSAYILIGVAIILKIIIDPMHAEYIISIFSIIWFILSSIYFSYIHIIYYSRVHKNSSEKLITILEDIGFSAERYLYIKATIISIDEEFASNNGTLKYLCTIRRERDGMIIHNVLLEDEKAKTGDKVKVSYFASELTDYHYTIIIR